MSDGAYTIELVAREGSLVNRYALIAPDGSVVLRSATKHPLRQWQGRLQAAFDLGRKFNHGDEGTKG